MTLDIMPVAMRVLSLFVILLIGVLCATFKLFDAKATKPLSNFVVSVTQPLLILISFQIEFTTERLMDGLYIAAVSAVFHFGASVIAKLIFGRDKQLRVLEFGTVFANCSFLGFPVLIMIFGSELGLFYGAFFTLFFNVYIRVYGIFLLNRERNGKMWFRAVINPGNVAAVCGLTLYMINYRLPDFLYDSFNYVGSSTFPLSMIVVGLMIGHRPMSSFFKLRVYVFALVKLLVVPAATLGICLLLPIEHFVIYICVIMSSMPAAANLALFSELYGGDTAVASSSVAVSTLLSVFSIPFFIYMTETALVFFGK